MSTVIERLETSGYKPEEKLLREFLKLARNSHTVSGAVDGGYFKVLLRLSIDLASVKKAHNQLYPIVKEECITEDMNAQQRNKATNFARSAYSTLSKAERAGMVLVSTFTKEEIIEWTKNKTKPIDGRAKVIQHIRDLNYLIGSGQVTRDEVLKLIQAYI